MRSIKVYVTLLETSIIAVVVIGVVVDVVDVLVEG